MSEVDAELPSDSGRENPSEAVPRPALRWCGRAKAAHAASSCDPARVASLASQLHPRVTIGPPESGMTPDPDLAAALAELGPQYNLEWDAEDPDVIVGRLSIAI